MGWLNDVEVFVRVVQTGNFTATAEELNMSKSVISKYVTQLENDLGARLLHRTTRRLSLTEAGQVFFERCRLGLQESDGARSEVVWMQGEPRGTLKLTAPMYVVYPEREFLSPKVAAFIDSNAVGNMGGMYGESIS